jgi:hypothetical protein
MQNGDTAKSQLEARSIRVILELSPDLKELRSVFPPGNSDEEDMRVLRLFQESFAHGGAGEVGSNEKSAA